MSYPVVIPYIRTRDNGQELRYSLRSLANLTNCNGQVYIIGDSERWFSSSITHIPHKRVYGRPYFDQVVKMLSVIDTLPEKFIASQDDIFICQSFEAGFYHQGELLANNGSYHARTKTFTRTVLLGRGIANPLDFELHYPFLVDTAKMREILLFIYQHPKSHLLQWRSLYGNLHQPPSHQAVDQKTKTAKLPDGAVISTNFYTRELDNLFPDKSEFEL